jgi:hypothetical protein
MPQAGQAVEPSRFVSIVIVIPATRCFNILKLRHVIGEKWLPIRFNPVADAIFSIPSMM